MGVLDRIGRGVESRLVTGGVNANVFFDAQAARKTYSGRPVTIESALTGTIAVYAAVSLKAETVGSLPLDTFKRISERERRIVNPVVTRWPGSLARMLHDGPNPEMSGQEYWENVEGHKDLWGNHYSYIVRDSSGRPKEAWPLRPDKMEVFRDTDRDGLPVGQRRYLYTLPNGEKRALNRAEIFHVMDLNTDGVKGISRIEVARNAVGIEQAAAEYAGRFFSNSAIPGGALVDPRPKPLKKEEVDERRKQWEASIGGLSHANRIAILHGGMDWKSIGIPPKDAQFVELRRFQIEEVGRLYRIPPHLLGDSTKESSWGTGIEQMTIGFVVYTLRPDLKRIEGAINRDFRDPQAGRTLLDENLYAEFKVDGLLRGDMAARSAFYASGIQNGYFTREDVRAWENLPPMEGLDRPLIPANSILLDENGEPPAPPKPQQPALPLEPEPETNGRKKALDEAYAAHWKQLGR